jgi:hypothetical protein
MIFIAALAGALGVLYFFAFRRLPREGWQFIASVPVRKLDDRRWQAKNLTWYGAIMAFSLAAAAALFTVLARAADVPPLRTALFIGIIISAAAPFAKIIARLVEKRRGTLTIGGAVFVGILIAPPAALLLERLFPGPGGLHAPLLAAVVTAYALGEGIGRLSCLSFGCCYGKKLADCGPAVRKIFGMVPMVFYGKTKKAAYAGGLEGEKLVPIQAVTAVLYSAVALGSSYLFLSGSYRTSFLLAALGTLLWRPASELLRADYRGGAKISAYQWMSLFGALYSALAAFALPFPPASAAPDILRGLAALADWRLILGLQGLFIALFLYTGVSVVTEGTVEFRVRREITGG